jgi:hypothetical protein
MLVKIKSYEDADEGKYLQIHVVETAHIIRAYEDTIVYGDGGFMGYKLVIEAPDNSEGFVVLNIDDETMEAILQQSTLETKQKVA